jgi:G3E family GTPase
LKTSKEKTENGFVNKDLLIGLDSHLANPESLEELSLANEKDDDNIHHSDEVEVFGFESDKVFDKVRIEEVLKKYSNIFDSEFYRIKGIVNTADGAKLLNWVCGRLTWSNLEKPYPTTKVTFMGKNILILKDELMNELDVDYLSEFRNIKSNICY